MSLLQADARRLPIADASVHLILTDPPYNIGTPQRVTFDASKRLIGRDFGVFDKGSITPEEWLPEVLRVLAPGGVLATFYGARNMDTLLTAAKAVGLEVIQDFHWCKLNPPVPMRSVGFSWGTESGYVFRRRGEKHRHNNAAGISPNWMTYPLTPNRERTLHPTQKPEAVIAWLMNHWSFPGDVVLDPFVGSGTTVCVAHRLGRKGIGCDLSREYLAMAQRRLWKQPIGSLFTEAF